MLSQDQAVVDALKKILEGYNYLEYDEVHSNNRDLLKVKLTRLDCKLDHHGAQQICKKLECATGKKICPPGITTTGGVGLQAGGTYFNIREDKS